MSGISTVSITDNLRIRLKVMASYQNLTYENLLENLLYVYEAEQPFYNHKEFSSWFEKNYELFGFKKIIQKSTCRTPDFIMEDRDNKVGIELELIDSNFSVHKEDILNKKVKIDYVIAAYATKSEMFGIPILALKRSPSWKLKLTLDIDDVLWEKFKEKVPHTKTMNQAVVELIKKEVGEGEDKL